MADVVERNAVDVEEDQIESQETETQKPQPESYEQPEVKKFTQEEVDKIIQKRLAREKEATEEAKRLAKMNAEEKAKYELEKKEQALSDREAEINRRELTAEAKDMLAERGLPLELHTLINYTSAETVQDSIKALEGALQKATELAVGERLKGNAPKVSTGVALKTKDQILSISNPIERQRTIAENIELFN